MTALESLDWHRSFGALTERLDRADFWPTLVRQLARELYFDTWLVLIFENERPPAILAESDEDDGTDEALFQGYQRGLYLLDPFYLDALEGRGSGLVTLAEIAPQHFTATEYYRRYFQRNIVTDEVQFNCALDRRRTLCLSLGSNRPFSREALGLLSLVQPWVLALMRQRMHFEQVDKEMAVHPWHPAGAGKIEADSLLTERERQVSRLMLGGCATREIARRLDISVETVRAHKKHLYAKLGIGSQSELFAVFWQSRRPE